MSLDDIWDTPADPPSTTSPVKRPRQSLFFSDSDSDDARPPKRGTPAPPSDVDALFNALDQDDDDLTYKPLLPALNVAKLTKEAEERHARGGGSKAGGTENAKKDPFGKDQQKAKSGDGDNKTRKVLPKLDEERLVGPEGFPQLINDIRGFQPKGKGNEHTDLNRLLQVYQFWAHRMYPKMSFKDTINRVEKLCHSKRMQVRLSVWRDEFKGVTIDLTEPTPVETEGEGDDNETQDPPPQSDQASSRPPSLPPTSSEPGDDDFDIDAVIRAEEERLSALRTAQADSEAPHQLLSSPVQKHASRSSPDADAMDMDEASLWKALEDPPMVDLPESNPPPSVPPDDDEDMWDIADQMEQGGPSKPATTAQIPMSGVNLIPSLDSTQSGNTTRATNDDDWDDMYL